MTTTATKSKQTPLPKSKAKNAYDLLGDVIKAVSEEPKRLDMTTFVDRLVYENDIANEYPACGTVGCVAGWTALLRNSRVSWSRAFVQASGLLGIKAQRAFQIWSTSTSFLDPTPFESDWHALCSRDFPTGRSGTKRYAMAVVRRIKAFMAKHADHLKAVKLAPRTK